MILLIGPSFFVCPSMLLEVVEGELALAEPGLLLGHLLLVELLLGLLDQRQHVAHAEDAAGHAVGMELLQGVEVLAGADELDRHAGDGLDRQRGAAAGVAVELGHDHAVELQRLVERLGAADGVLAGHRVDHQVDLVGTDAAVDLRQLAHQLFVDVQPAGRVEDHHFARRWPWPASRPPGTGPRGPWPPGRHRPAMPSCWPSTCNCWMAAGRCKSAATSIGLRPPLLEQSAQLAAGGRLARALQAAEHQHRHFAAEVQRMVDRPHQVDQFLMDDADQLLGRVERFEHRLADGLLARPGR